MQHEPSEPYTRRNVPPPQPPVDENGSIGLPDIPPGLAPGMYAHDFLPKGLPASTWEVVFNCPNGRRYKNKRRGISVIASGWDVADMTIIDPTAEMVCKADKVQNCHVCAALTCGDCTTPRAQWMHLSIARKKKRPSLGDIDLVQRLFCGGRETVLYLPDVKGRRAVNIAHLFTRADEGRVMAVPALLIG